MILYWKDSNYARYLKLGVSIMGAVHEGKRPDVIILTKKEHSKLTHDDNPVERERRSDYLHTLLMVTSTPNVIVAR